MVTTNILIYCRVCRKNRKMKQVNTGAYRCLLCDTLHMADKLGTVIDYIGKQGKLIDGRKEKNDMAS